MAAADGTLHADSLLHALSSAEVLAQHGYTNGAPGALAALAALAAAAGQPMLRIKQRATQAGEAVGPHPMQ
jgi:hypothetical protein